MCVKPNDHVVLLTGRINKKNIEKISYLSMELKQEKLFEHVLAQQLFSLKKRCSVSVVYLFNPRFSMWFKVQFLIKKIK